MAPVSFFNVASSTSDESFTTSLSLVKQELYAANLQLFDSLGISNPDSIDLDPFTVHISLWNYTYKGQMFNSKIEVK